MTDITDDLPTDLESRSARQLSRTARIALLRELSGAIGHELNQPLTSILSNAQAAERFLEAGRANPQEMREILADIVAETKRAGEAIRRLGVHLDHETTGAQPLDVRAVIRRTLAMARSELRGRDCRVSVQLPPRLPLVHGSLTQLEQVLLSLLMYAGAADTQSGSRVEISAQAEAVDGGMHLTVRGYGYKSDPDQPAHATNPYCLSFGLCRTIIAVHGGRLLATNDAEGNSAFHITLPVYKKEENA
jgi:two-component system, LuxR family, sensor kinase FixL